MSSIDPEVHEIDERIASFLLERWDEPDTPLITEVVIVANYVDADGDDRWSAHTMGNGRTTSAVGLLEFGKAWLLDKMLHDEYEDD